MNWNRRRCKQTLKVRLVLCLFCLTFGFLHAQTRTEMFGTTEVVSHEVLIRFNHSTHFSGDDVKAAKDRSIIEITRAADISQVEPVGGVGVYLLRSRTVGVPDLIDQLKIRSDVAY